MDDRQWDDWVRGNPGTFWGDEKNRINKQYNDTFKYKPPPFASKAKPVSPSTISVTNKSGSFSENSQTTVDPVPVDNKAQEYGLGFIVAGVLAYLAYNGDVRMEWYWWCGMFLGVWVGVGVYLSWATRVMNILRWTIVVGAIIGVIWVAVAMFI